MVIHFYYFIAAIVLGLLGYYTSSVTSFIFYWSCSSFLVVTAAYLIKQPNVFNKSRHGEIPLHINLLLLPFISVNYLHNLIAQYFDKTDKVQKIDKDFFIASRLNIDDLKVRDLNATDEKITYAIVDMTAETSSLNWQAPRLKLAYLNTPTLAQQTPDIDSLQRTLFWIDEHISQGHKVIVQCGLGTESSVFVAAAYLLIKYPQLTIAGVLQKIQAIRPQANMHPEHINELVEYRRTHELYAYPTSKLALSVAIREAKWKPQYANGM